MPESLRSDLERLSPPEAAKRLLGCHLVSGRMTAQIVEVEAYNGPDDPGSHAYRGRTPRNRALFGPPGLCYVYFCYGTHWMLNVASQPDGVPGALLIRAAKPLTGIEEMKANRPKARREYDLLSGPGKICAAYGIDAAHYGIDLLAPHSPLRIVPQEPVVEVFETVRVGLAPGKGDEIPWRFIDSACWEWASPPRQRPQPASSSA